MAELTKKELVEDAQDLGIEDPEALTRDELADVIAAHTPAELGPVIPDGELTAPAPKVSGTPTKGVQPQTPNDIPKWGR